MKSTTWLTILVTVLIFTTLACSSGLTGTPASAEQVVQVDTQATVEAAVAATAQVEQYLQATIDASVAATATAQPPQAPAEPPVEYVALTEEELEALIDESVSEAIAATESCSTAATQSTTDGGMTQEEVETVYDAYYYADESIYYAMELIEAYYGVYGDLAYEYLYLLEDIEDDLEMMAESMILIANSLEEASTALQNGVELAAETITQIETAAQQAAADLAETQAQMTAWHAQAQAGRTARAETAMNFQADLANVPQDRADVLLGAFDYIDTVRGSLADNQLSRDELNTIAQLGANVSAGLVGVNPQFSDLSQRLNDITGQLARGQVPTAQFQLGEFEGTLNGMPDLPDLSGRPSLGGGGINRPTRP